MYDVYPDLERLERRLGLKDGERLETVERLEVDGAFLRGVLEMILSDVAIDERAYLRDYDLKAEVDWGPADSIAAHFAGTGYFAGLVAVTRNFDEYWYLETYPEARLAVAERRYQSGLDHYRAEGRRQGRAPNAAALATMARWRQVLSGTVPDRVPIDIAPQQPTTEPEK